MSQVIAVASAKIGGVQIILLSRCPFLLVDYRLRSHGALNSADNYSSDEPFYVSVSCSPHVGQGTYTLENYSLEPENHFF